MTNYVQVPDWMPAPLKGYDYYVDGLELWMSPNPKIRHFMRYRPFYKLRAKIKARRWAKDFFNSLKE